MVGYTLTKFCNVTLITMEVMSCQVHAITKAIRPIFADAVTNTGLLHINFCGVVCTLLEFLYHSAIVINWLDTSFT